MAVNGAFVVLGYCFVVGTAVNIFETLLFVVKYALYENKESIPKLSLALVVISSIIYTLGGSFMAIFQFYVGNDFTNDNLGFLSNNIQASLENWGHFICFCYLLYLLHIMFNNTKYSISCCSFSSLFILLIIYVIICIIWTNLAIFDVRSVINNTSLDWNGRSQLLLVCKSTTLGIGSIVAIIFLILYFIKLHHMSRGVYNDFNAKITQFDGQENIDLSDVITIKQNFEDRKDILFIKGSKVIILSLIILVTLQIVFIVSLLEWIFKPYSQHTWWMIFGVAKLLNLYIIPVSLYMGFDFTDSWYNCCCNRCNACIKERINEKMDKKLSQISEYSLININN